MDWHTEKDSSIGRTMQIPIQKTIPPEEEGALTLHPLVPCCGNFFNGCCNSKKKLKRTVKLKEICLIAVNFSVKNVRKSTAWSMLLLCFYVGKVVKGERMVLVVSTGKNILRYECKVNQAEKNWRGSVWYERGDGVGMMLHFLEKLKKLDSRWVDVACDSSPATTMRQMSINEHERSLGLFGIYANQGSNWDNYHRNCGSVQ